jgi:tetratricopeptide (TPR) repeat protein
LRTPESDLLHAAELFNVGESARAQERLSELQQSHAEHPELFILLGQVWLRQGQWRSALDAYTRAVALDDENPHGHFGMAVAANRLGSFELGAEHALQSIGLLYFYPQAHFQLGVAFKGLGDRERAIRSFQLAVGQVPGYVDAHRELAELYRQTDNIPLWMKHQQIVSGLPPLP